jgi:hypothetical protein
VPPPVLASQSFNVTTDLHELIEAIANDYIAVDNTELDLPPPPEAAPPGGERDRQSSVAFPNSAQGAGSEVSFKASSQQPLPPQLHPAPAEPIDRSNRSIELPSFGQATTMDGEQASPEPEALDPDALDLQTSDVFNSDLDEPIVAEAAWVDEVLDHQSRKDSAPDLPVHTPPVPGLAAEAFNDEPIPDWESADRLWDSEPVDTVNSDTALTEAPEPDSPEQSAFRALNLQNRFWERLQSLMVDKELSHWLEVLQAEEAEETEGVSTEWGNDKALPFGRFKRRSIGKDAELAAQEVLAEDDPTPDSTPPTGSGEAIPPGMPVLPIDEAIPVPELQAPPGELTTGQTLIVTVKLPDSHPRIFVKLWLSERQSRTLLDAPRWLTDFLPDGFGNLITRTELTVPHGCVEIQVEAIAVEMVTQRESDKVTLVREVVPADLSSYSLDD